MRAADAAGDPLAEDQAGGQAAGDGQGAHDVGEAEQHLVRHRRVHAAVDRQARQQRGDAGDRGDQRRHAEAAGEQAAGQADGHGGQGGGGHVADAEEHDHAVVHRGTERADEPGERHGGPLGVGADGEAHDGQGGGDDADGKGLRVAGGHRLQRRQVHPDQVRQLQADADAGDDRAGEQQGLEEVGAGGHGRTGDGVLDRLDQRQPGEQDDDSRGHDLARSHLRGVVLHQGPDDGGRDRGDDAAGDALEEVGQPVPVEQLAHAHDQHRGDEGDQADEPGAAEHDRDGAAEEPPAEHRGQRAVDAALGLELVEGLLGGLGRGGAVLDRADEPVDGGELGEVGGQRAHHAEDGDGLLLHGADLREDRDVVHRDVAVAPVQAVGRGHRAHLHLRVRVRRPGAEQDVADACGDVHHGGDLRAVGQVDRGERGGRRGVRDVDGREGHGPLAPAAQAREETGHGGERAFLPTSTNGARRAVGRGGDVPPAGDAPYSSAGGRGARRSPQGRLSASPVRSIAAGDPLEWRNW